MKFLNGVGIGHLVDSKTCKNIWACLVVEINTFFFFFLFVFLKKKNENKKENLHLPNFIGKVILNFF